MKNCLYIIVPLFLFGHVCQAQQEEDLYDLSMEELMKIKVVSASKVEESLNDAPGIITSISREEINRFGANNVLEAIERSAGIFVTGNYFLPDNYISIRGDAASAYNRHVLILINGRPTRETLFGGVDFGVLKTLPLASVHSIEIIRGPGSVLYGSNAYTGVINIITKEEEDGFQARVSGGSFKSKQLEIVNHSTKEGLSVNTGLKYYRNDGWSNQITSELNESITREMGASGIGANVNISYKDFEMTGLVSHAAQNNFGILPVNSFPDATPMLNRDIASTRFMLDLGYQLDFSSTWNTQINTTFNESLISYDATGGDFEGESSDILMEVTNFISATENINAVVGATAYLMSAGGELAEFPGQGVAFTNQTWFSAYVQADYQPVERLKLIAGGQLNAPNGFDANFVPRLGVIYDVNKKMGFKALYGQAFRTAYIAEQYAVEPPILTGNPVLKPQTVQTTDLQAFYNTRKLQLSVTGFQSTMKNIITLTSPPNQTYLNEGEIRFEGLELEGKGMLYKDFFFNTSFTYQQSQNGALKNVTHVPQTLLKVGLNYHKAWFNMGVYDMYASEISSVNTVNNAAREVNPVPKDYHYMTLNLDVDMLKMLGKSTPYSLNFNTYVVNLLDEKIYYPEYTRRNINSIQGRPERAIYVRLVLGF